MRIGHCEVPVESGEGGQSAQVKKGIRILARRTLVWTGWGLVLLAGLAGLFVWHSYDAYARSIAEFERRVGPASHQRYLAQAVPDDANAALTFARAMTGVELAGDWTRAPEPAAWTAAEQKAARAVLAQEARALAALERAAELDQCAWPAIPETGLSWSGPMLQASRLLRIHGFVGVLDGSGTAIEGSFDSLGALSDCLYRQPQLVGSLVATAVERARLEVVRAALASPGLDPATVDQLEAGMRRSLESDRVAWAIAAEGAFALGFIENPGLAAGEPSRNSAYTVFSRRVAAHLAERWVGLKAWSEQPLEALLVEGVEESEPSAAMTTVIADLLIPNLRDAVFEMRTIEALTRLGLVAIEGRRQAMTQGSYDGAFAAHPELGTLPEASGGIVLRDPGLESLLRERYASPGTEAPGVDATLGLTTWRLPPLASTAATERR